jgi:hypothetical protein
MASLPSLLVTEYPNISIYIELSTYEVMKLNFLCTHK